MDTGLQGMLDQVLGGNVDAQRMEQATSAHMDSMDGSQLIQHVETAIGNARQNGQPGIAQELEGLLQQHQSNPDNLKDEVISLIRSRPELLQHFAPGFAQGVLSRIRL